MKADHHFEAALPSDRELELLTDYIGGYMTVTEVEAFENQMRLDEKFFFRIAPMLSAWYLDESTALSAVECEEIADDVGTFTGVADDRRPVVDSARPIEVRAPHDVIEEWRTRVRWHLLTALGSAASIKPLMAAAGLAAASMTFAYLGIQRERGLDNAAPQTLAIKPADTTHKSPTLSPRAKTTAVAVTVKHPRSTKRTAPPIQETEVPVTPMLVADSAQASPLLPPLGVAFTPSSVIAQNDAMVLRGSEIGAPPRDLGGTKNGIPVPGALTGKKAPGDLPMPKGGISRVPIIGRIWDWLNNH